jgi:hypothetical protein
MLRERCSIKVKKRDPKQVAAAIKRLPRQASASIRQILENAGRLGEELIVEACQEELRARGTLDLTKEGAEQASEIATRIAGKVLAEVIEIAFTEVPAKPEEHLILKWIFQHPGTSQAEIRSVYAKRDLSLVIGHLIYDRFGYFRPMLSSAIQSDLLLGRDNSSGNVRYTLRPEAVTAFSAIGILS